MALLRHLQRLCLTEAGCSVRGLSQAATAAKFYDVPEGHSTSDLAQAACNIGLNRRRDLTKGASAEIKLTVDGKQQTLPELLKVTWQPSAQPIPRTRWVSFLPAAMQLCIQPRRLRTRPLADALSSALRRRAT